jgi:hypothetical protein
MVAGRARQWYDAEAQRRQKEGRAVPVRRTAMRRVVNLCLFLVLVLAISLSSAKSGDETFFPERTEEEARRAEAEKIVRQTREAGMRRRRIRDWLESRGAPKWIHWLFFGPNVPIREPAKLNVKN